MAENNAGNEQLPVGGEGVAHDRIESGSDQAGASLVAVAERVEKAVEASDTKPGGQGIDRAEFLNLVTAGIFFGHRLAEKREQKTAVAETPEEQLQTPGGVTVDLPLHVEVAVGPLLAWAGTATNPKVKERRVVIGCVVAAVLAVFGGAGVGVVLSGKEIIKKVITAQEFKKLPAAIQKESIRRDQAEQASQTFQYYKDGRYAKIVNLWDVESNLTRRLMGEIGPTWMFVPERRDVVNYYLEEEFTVDQVAEFRINPQKKDEFFKILESLRDKGRITQDVVYFYHRDPAEVLRELESK